jgi:hypothetical protein
MSRSNNARFREDDLSYTSSYTGEVVIVSPKSDRRVGLIDGRRPWVRKPRYPNYGYKRFHNAPPRWWWQEQHARVRQIHRQIMMREEDPVLPDEKDLINLWDWY